MPNKSLWLYIVFTLCGFATVAQPSVPRPSLVVVVTVEGLDGDMVNTLSPVMVGGLARLSGDGVTIRNLDFGSPLEAAAASAVLFTGTAPGVNGIPAASFYETSTKLPRPIYLDKSTIGQFTDETLSPKALKVSTVADELRIATGGDSRVYSVASNSNVALAGAGHAGNGAYWINPMTGNWASSAYYKDLPTCLKERNYKNPLSSRLDTMKWIPSADLNLYLGVGESDKKKGFVEKFPKKDINRVKSFLTSPLANTEVTDMAITLMKDALAGNSGTVDLISVGYILRTDTHGLQLADAYMRLDKDLSRLMDEAIKIAGRDRVIFVMAGLPSPSGYMPDDKQWGVPSGLYSVKRAIALLDIQLMAVHGNGDWITGYHDRNFYLNRNLIKDRGLDLQAFRREVADFLGRMSGISDVMTIDDIMASRAGENPAALKRNTSLTHAGDVIIEVAPGWQIVDDGSGKASGIQRLTPPVAPAYIMAPGLKPHVIDGTIDARTLAPTVSRLMHIRVPNGASRPALSLF